MKTRVVSPYLILAVSFNLPQHRRRSVWKRWLLGKFQLPMCSHLFCVDIAMFLPQLLCLVFLPASELGVKSKSCHQATWVGFLAPTLRKLPSQQADYWVSMPEKMFCFLVYLCVCFPFATSGWIQDLLLALVRDNLWWIKCGSAECKAITCYTISLIQETVFNKC